jgi:hypothetical protein
MIPTCKIIRVFGLVLFFSFKVLICEVEFVAANVPGGWSNAELTKEHKDLLIRALETENDADKKRVCIKKILSVRQQVVAGMNYCFHVKICEVDTASNKELGYCTTRQCNSTKAIIQIFEQPWTNTLEVTKIQLKVDTKEL